ncbi:MAG: hypothetical protein G01um101438_155 [Parcubacteria group bacterium Gr01-1014_38]|nr:MAG: hypothetical protein G01um101438_155 [Parcubacteria group bacterium Gr01-1014_38]
MLNQEGMSEVGSHIQKAVGLRLRIRQLSSQEFAEFHDLIRRMSVDDLWQFVLLVEKYSGGPPPESELEAMRTRVWEKLRQHLIQSRLERSEESETL